jgi:hypothetical protein
VIATLAAGSVTWTAVATFESDNSRASRHVLSQADVRRQLVGGTPTAQEPTPTRSATTDAPEGRGADGGRGETAPPSTGPSTGSASSSGPPQAPETTGAPHQPPSRPSQPSGASTPPTTHTGSPQPHPQSRSWSFDGGRAGATCSGSLITSFYATPDDGWAYTVDDNGPEQLRLRFHAEESLTTLTAHCVGGAPVAQIQEWGEGGDEGAVPGGDGRMTPADPS